LRKLCIPDPLVGSPYWQWHSRSRNHDPRPGSSPLPAQSESQSRGRCPYLLRDSGRRPRQWLPFPPAASPCLCAQQSMRPTSCNEFTGEQTKKKPCVAQGQGEEPVANLTGRQLVNPLNEFRCRPTKQLSLLMVVYEPNFHKV